MSKYARGFGAIGNMVWGIYDMQVRSNDICIDSEVRTGVVESDRTLCNTK